MHVGAAKSCLAEHGDFIGIITPTPMGKIEKNQNACEMIQQFKGKMPVKSWRNSLTSIS